MATSLSVLYRYHYVAVSKYRPVKYRTIWATTRFLEGKIQRTLRKIKQSLLTDVYAKLYQTGSLPG